MKICVIPARGQSRRIPRKNIKDFMDAPIISYSIALAKLCCDQVIVSTEDQGVAAVAADHGAEVYQRPFALAEDEVGTQEVVADCLKSLRIARSARVLVLYPCAPLLDLADVAGYADMPGYVVAVGAEPLRDAGAFYWGTCQDFITRIPLYNGKTRLAVLPENKVCDVNLPEDWTRLELMYQALHDMEISEAREITPEQWATLKP